MTTKKRKSNGRERGGKASMKTGVELIAEERTRQFVEKGYNHAYDAKHEDEELADVAAIVACTYRINIQSFGFPEWVVETSSHIMRKWTDNRIHQLAIAGALIAAEIDRLQRAANAVKERT